MRLRKSRRRENAGFILPLILGGVWFTLLGFGWVFWRLAFHLGVSPSIEQGPAPPILLTDPERGASATTDVRGNLGPASVVLQNSTVDWLKDRWQAASDMHGTAIRGAHWVHVNLDRPGRVRRFLLDWETAYAEDYSLEGWYHNQRVAVYFDSQEGGSQEMRHSKSFGQSPGVKQNLPLHIIHEITCQAIDTSVKVDEIRLIVRKPFHPSWGVSLWRFQAFGHDV